LYPELHQIYQFNKKVAKSLLSFGSWITVSNIVGPLLLYLGRVFIIIMLSAEAVAYFVTPYEIVSRLLIIPGVVVSVIFPAFTHFFVKKESVVKALYRKSLLYIFIIMLPTCLFGFLFAREGLSWWINEDFSQNSYLVAQLLIVGVFLNSFGHISQTLIQGYGRPDLTAKLHLLELVTYIPYLMLLIDTYKIEGAALAWTIRVALSTVVLAYLASRCLKGTLRHRAS
jgi:O-antigen/teichoic acid export membrane protein